MSLFPFLFLTCLTTGIIIPIQTGQQRCMALYSLNEDDSLKVSVKFPVDSSVDKFYDFITEIRDLNENVIVKSLPNNYVTRIEITVPNQNIYQACIKISHNYTKSANYTHKYSREILVEYEANTHFITDQTNFPHIYNPLKESQILALHKQAAQVINATQEYIRLQAFQKQLQMREFQQRREIQDSIFDWWMLELLLILSLGLYQWMRMKRKLQGHTL